MPVAVRRLLVVLALAGAGFVPAPATAAGYCSGSGVNVVVDFGALGGGIAKDCDSSGNRNAAHAFVNTGHPLNFASNQRGFVCRVNGVPASDPCVNTSPADAYWGLYWSDGSGGWKYSSLGATSLTIPAGGSVAFSWQNGGGDPPGVAPASPAPATHAPAPTPTKLSTKHATMQPSAGATSAPRSGTPSASATGTAAAAAAGSATPSASSTTAAATSTAPSTGVSGPASAGEASTTDLTPAADDDGSGLAWWIPVGVLVGLVGGGGAAWWTRRRSSA